MSFIYNLYVHTKGEKKKYLESASSNRFPPSPPTHPATGALAWIPHPLCCGSPGGGTPALTSWLWPELAQCQRQLKAPKTQAAAPPPPHVKRNREITSFFAFKTGDGWGQAECPLCGSSTRAALLGSPMPAQPQGPGDNWGPLAATPCPIPRGRVCSPPPPKCCIQCRGG